jgi:hypothetical protein
MKQKFLVCILLLALFYCLSNSAVTYAEKVTKPRVEVTGQITDTRMNEIKVKDAYYNISGAKLVTQSGNTTSASDLVRGKSVRISIDGDTVRQILIYDINETPTVK